MGELGRWFRRRRRFQATVALVLGLALSPASSPAAGLSLPQVSLPDGSLPAILDPLVDQILGQQPVRDVVADEAYFVARINEERRTRGLRTLVVRSDLTAAARRHAGRMAAKLEIWHNLGLDDEVAGWLTIGENVGWSRTDAVELHQSFMDSPEHRENILWPAFNEIGIGEIVGSDGRIFVGQVFAERRTSVRSSTAARAAAAAARTLERGEEPAPIPVPPQTLSHLLRILQLA